MISGEFISRANGNILTLTFFLLLFFFVVVVVVVVVVKNQSLSLSLLPPKCKTACINIEST